MFSRQLRLAAKIRTANGARAGATTGRMNGNFFELLPIKDVPYLRYSRERDVDMQRVNILLRI